MSTTGAFSVGQCVTKRTRQLERMLYMVESTATKFHDIKAPAIATDVAMLGLKSRADVQDRYGKILLDFLEKQRSLHISALLADALHLEHYDEELQQLLVLVEDEEVLRERVSRTWDFLHASSINQDIVERVRACQLVWNDLLPQISSTSLLIRQMRGDPDTPAWLRDAEAACSAVHPWPSVVQRTTRS